MVRLRDYVFKNIQKPNNECQKVISIFLLLKWRSLYHGSSSFLAKIQYPVIISVP